MNHYAKSTVALAAAIPASAVDNHPEAVAARREVEEARLRAMKAHAAIPRVNIHVIHEHIGMLRSQLQTAMSSFNERALADLLKGDLNFSDAVAHMPEVQAARWRHDAAVAALEAYTRRAPDFTAPLEAEQSRANEAERRYKAIIERLKLERAHERNPRA